MQSYENGALRKLCLVPSPHQPNKLPNVSVTVTPVRILDHKQEVHIHKNQLHQEFFSHTNIMRGFGPITGLFLAFNRRVNATD